MKKKDRPLSFELEELCAGWLCMKITQGKREDWIECDEAFTDPFPGLSILYNKLKEREPYDFLETGSRRDYSFEIGQYEGDTVVLTIDSYVVYRERMKIGDLMKMLERFFRSIRESPGYPTAFPCGCWGKTDEFCEWEEEAERRCERYFTKWTDAAEKREMKLCSRYARSDHALTEEGQRYIKKYDRMLYRQEVPESWEARRKY